MLYEVITLEEIDANLARCPGIRTALTVVVGSGNDSRLVAVYQPGEKAPDPEAVRAHLAENLPSYMIPQRCQTELADSVYADSRVVRIDGKFHRGGAVLEKKK